MVSRRTVNVHYLNGIKESIESGIVPFFEMHNELEFYAIYFDISLLTGEIIVSLNTEFDYKRRQKYYESHFLDSSINVRYLISEWNYQGVVSCIPVDVSVFEAVYQSKPETFSKMCINYIREVLGHYLCSYNGEVIVHFGDEPIETSIQRYNKYCSERT